MPRKLVTNYYKLHMPIGPGRGSYKEFVFFDGEGPPAAEAYREVSALRAELCIPEAFLSVFRVVPGVPAGIPAVGEVSL